MNFWVLTTLDAAGLALFAVSGSAKAMEAGIHPLLATMMGGITAVGGGTLRDLLLARIPTVLRSDIYASAALLGSAATITCLRLRLSPLVSSLVGILTCFSVRMLAVRFHWNLPGAEA